MRWLVVICVAFGCGDREAEQMAKVKDQVCACKTASCADAAMKNVPQGKVKAGHKAQGIAREIMECVAKLNEAERPTTDPDAPR